jgi:hypothetical protein
MNDNEINLIIAQLNGKRDKHIIAHAYNCRNIGNGEQAVTVEIGNRKKAVFRRLGLIEKRPGHKSRIVAEADHILTPLGLEIGKAITTKFKLALAKL